MLTTFTYRQPYVLSFIIDSRLELEFFWIVCLISTLSCAVTLVGHLPASRTLTLISATSANRRSHGAITAPSNLVFVTGS